MKPMPTNTKDMPAFVAMEPAESVVMAHLLVADASVSRVHVTFVAYLLRASAARRPRPGTAACACCCSCFACVGLRLRGCPARLLRATSASSFGLQLRAAFSASRRSCSACSACRFACFASAFGLRLGRLRGLLALRPPPASWRAASALAFVCLPRAARRAAFCGLRCGFGAAAPRPARAAARPSRPARLPRPASARAAAPASTRWRRARRPGCAAACGFAPRVPRLGRRRRRLLRRGA